MTETSPITFPQTLWLQWTRIWADYVILYPTVMCPKILFDLGLWFLLTKLPYRF